jgi:hypothetical protein
MKTNFKKDSAPFLGGSLMAVNVNIVATTGYRASKLLKSDIYNDKGKRSAN